MGYRRSFSKVGVVECPVRVYSRGILDFCARITQSLVGWVFFSGSTESQQGSHPVVDNALVAAGVVADIRYVPICERRVSWPPAFGLSRLRYAQRREPVVLGRDWSGRSGNLPNRVTDVGGPLALLAQ